MMDIKKYISCSCESETILLQKFKNEDEIYLSLFSRGLNIKRYGIFDRIRHIWQILLKGFPYTDEIVLDKKRALELSKIIKTLCK
jgi:hypothetical protein